MAEKDKNGAQNIDGVLKQLKRSYSADAPNENSGVAESESASADVSGDELQAILRSQYLGNETQIVESGDDYSIDEEFLKDAYTEDEDHENDFIDKPENSEEEENEEENDYGFYEEAYENSEEDPMMKGLKKFKKKTLAKKIKQMKRSSFMKDLRRFKKKNIMKPMKKFMRRQKIKKFKKAIIKAFR